MEYYERDYGNIDIFFKRRKWSILDKNAWAGSIIPLKRLLKLYRDRIISSRLAGIGYGGVTSYGGRSTTLEDEVIREIGMNPREWEMTYPRDLGKLTNKIHKLDEEVWVLGLYIKTFLVPYDNEQGHSQFECHDPYPIIDRLLGTKFSYGGTYDNDLARDILETY